MKAPSLARLLTAFRDLSPEKAMLIRALCHDVDAPDALRCHIETKCEATHAYVRSLYSDPYDSRMWRRTVALHAIDKILDTFGVESLGEVDMREGPPYEYCNAGDPYVATLIYQRNADTLFIGCWGDLVEAGKVG
jgi:hypothetical protein